METLLWAHQTLESAGPPAAHDTTVQTFTCGLLVGVIIVATVLLWRRPRSRRGTIRSGAPIVTGWGDLFRLVGAIVRGGLWLIAALLLLGRVLFWPAGRRW